MLVTILTTGMDVLALNDCRLWFDALIKVKIIIIPNYSFSNGFHKSHRILIYICLYVLTGMMRDECEYIFEKILQVELDNL